MYYIDLNNIELDQSMLEKAIDSILSYLDEKREFSIHFVSDNEIKALNSEYRGIDSPTDILTFAMNDGMEFPLPEDNGDLGDIFISIDSMKRNAKEFNVPEDEELRRLLLHGILHLRGLDHKSNDFSTEPMLIEQEKILKDLGFKA